MQLVDSGDFGGAVEWNHSGGGQGGSQVPQPGDREKWQQQLSPSTDLPQTEARLFWPAARTVCQILY